MLYNVAEYLNFFLSILDFTEAALQVPTPSLSIPWPYSCLGTSVSEDCTKLPGMVKLKQVYCLWNYILCFQERKEQTESLPAIFSIQLGFALPTK